MDENPIKNEFGSQDCKSDDIELPHDGLIWHSLEVKPTELRIEKSLVSGQSFRWIQTNISEWTCVLDTSWITLRQTNDDVLFTIRNNQTVEEVRRQLRSYFQLDILLAPLWKEWRNDSNFEKKSIGFEGLRILKQPKLETILSFICSSNNNIPRITSMVQRLCKEYGDYYGNVLDHNQVNQEFYSFPTLQSLNSQKNLESKLREFGFGYRAKYIAISVKFISDQGESWLANIHQMEDTKSELLKLTGVGPKVADCICLFSMDKYDAIPVDTHVWQIAQRDYNLKGTTLTPKVYKSIHELFLKKFGTYSGWAHTILFAADLSMFQKGPTKKRKR
ncbi:DNA glycosylase [Globomyces pollinis-pini]|nr:DNA glycosylase [Globomyces pollinis-pini]